MPGQPNQQHIDHLLQNPHLAPQFDQKLGAGAAAPSTWWYPPPLRKPKRPGVSRTGVSFPRTKELLPMAAPGPPGSTPLFSRTHGKSLGVRSTTWRAMTTSATIAYQLGLGLGRLVAWLRHRRGRWNRGTTDRALRSAMRPLSIAFGASFAGMAIQLTGLERSPCGKQELCPLQNVKLFFQSAFDETCRPFQYSEAPS